MHTLHLLPNQTTYKNMKKLSLSLTAWLLSLTALLLSAMLLASCENKAAQGTSPKVAKQYELTQKRIH